MTYARLTFALAAVLFALTVSVGTASATTTAQCQAQLSQLRTDTVAAGSSFTNAKDVNGAVGKLDAAAAKLGEGKNTDATAKLADFQSLLTALSTAPKPKLDPAVAASLQDEAQGVIDCINAIDAP